MSAQLTIIRPLQPASNTSTKRPILRLVIPQVETGTLTGVDADEIAELAEALRDDDGLGMLEAICQAADMLDDLDTYSAGWNSMAFLAGNRDAMPF